MFFLFLPNIKRKDNGKITEIDINTIVINILGINQSLIF